MTATQMDKATRFRALHAGPGAFVIPNPWDAGAARMAMLTSRFNTMLSIPMRYCMVAQQNGGL